MRLSNLFSLFFVLLTLSFWVNPAFAVKTPNSTAPSEGFYEYYAIKLGREIPKQDAAALLEAVKGKFPTASLEEIEVYKNRIIKSISGLDTYDGKKYFTVHVDNYFSKSDAEKMYRFLSEMLTNDQKKFLRIEVYQIPKGKKCNAEKIKNLIRQGKSPRDVVREAIKEGEDACCVIENAIEALRERGDGVVDADALEQVILGAMDAEAEADVIAYCCMGAGMDPDGFAAIMGELGFPYTFGAFSPQGPFSFGQDNSDESGAGPSGGILSPFAPSNPSF